MAKIELKPDGVARDGHYKYAPRSTKEAKIKKPKVEALNVEELEKLVLTAQ